MRHLELERGNLLRAQERVVRPPVAAKHGWLVVTDHRLLIVTPGRRHEPPRVELAEELGAVTLEHRRSWLRQQSLRVTATDGATRRVVLTASAGRRTRFGMTRALREIVGDVARWQRAAIAAPVEQVGTEAFELAHLRLLAADAATPGRLARLLGVEAAEVTDRVERPAGNEFSRGATTGFTYTAHDEQLFPPTVRTSAFDRLVSEFGEAQVLQRARQAGGSQWWQTSSGSAAEQVLELMDLPVAHVSDQREPIRSWQKRVAWVGLFGAAVMTVFSVALLLPLMILWRSSYNGWLDGSLRRPQAAIVLGLVTVGLVGAMAIAVVVAGVIELVGI